ncbi:MAG: ABC transporter ATP-binding protein [Deltaproteobacteria bacterium]|nr:ABC transporter ATP-binding protein [Deltaproteobacteria bacterium]
MDSPVEGRRVEARPVEARSIEAHAIEVRDLTKTFGDFVAVDRVTFDVARGEIFGYLGANGAGKSTTIRILSGLLLPTSGQARVHGVDVASEPERVKRSIGYMSQRFSLYPDLSVTDNLEFFGGAFGMSGRILSTRIDELLERVDLTLARRTRTRELPGGMRQRLALASALLHSPPILFLDEPTSGVDPSARRNFWHLIRDLSQQGTTVFVTTHYMDEAEYCERIGLMADGRLVALDTPANLKRTFIPEPIFRVESDAATLGPISDLLGGVPGIVNVETFGPALHVRTATTEAQPIDHLRQSLARAGFKARVEAIAPTLEDVFLEAVTRK